MKRLLVVVAMCAGLTGCAPSLKSYSSPGTLYVSTKSQGVRVYENGREIALRGEDLVRAAEWGKYLASPVNSACDGEYAVSPDGTRAICGRTSDPGLLLLFDPRNLHTKRVVSREFSDANGSGLGWLDNGRFAALEADRSCPGGHLYDYGFTRAAIFDRTGKLVSKSSCALGLIAGHGRMALLGDAPNDLAWRLRSEIVGTLAEYDFNGGYDKYHLTWSVDDGASWHEGRPLTFDGNGKLLYSEIFSNGIHAEDGRIAFKDADWVNWSSQPWKRSTSGT